MTIKKHPIRDADELITGEKQADVNGAIKYDFPKLQLTDEQVKRAMDYIADKGRKVTQFSIPNPVDVDIFKSIKRVNSTNEDYHKRKIGFDPEDHD